MLTLLRHGRTAANASGLLQGRIDNPLDDHGLAQAVAAANVLSAVDVVIASPLIRAQATASLVASANNIEVQTDDRFIELDYGEYDALPLRNIPPEAWKRWQTDPDFAPPGGERPRDLHRRVTEALEELSEVASERHVVVVSHMSPIKVAVQWALGVESYQMSRMTLAPAAICRIDFRGTRPALSAFNDVGHLANI